MADHPRLCQGRRLHTHPGPAVAAPELRPGTLLAADRGWRGTARHCRHRRQAVGRARRHAARAEQGATRVTAPAKVQSIRRRERASVSRMIGRWPEDIWFEDADVPSEGFFKGAEREAVGM